jgi:V/A-type H+/Na+-transporting ATPase subunit I
MAVLAMNKIQILGLKKDLQKVLAYLQESGIVQIDEVKIDEDLKVELESLDKKDHDVDYNVAQLDFAIKLLKDHAPKRPIWAGKPSLSVKKAKETIKNFDYKSVIKDCQELEEKHVADQNETTQLQAESKLLTDWKRLPFELNVPRETETTRIHIGTVPKAEYEEFRQELAKMSELTGIQKIDTDDTSVRTVAVVSKKHADEAKILFGKFKFQEIELPVYEMSAKDRLEEIEKRLITLADNLKMHIKGFEKLAKHFENLQVAHDVFAWQQDEVRIHERLKGTDFSFMIEGWVAKLDKKKLEEGLKKVATVAIEKIKPGKDEEAPIYLHNKRVTWPFESVTRLYGFPTASEVDPTPFLALFFIVFFGLCLTDFGYGLSLAVIMLVMLKFFNLPKESTGLIKLLMIGGIVTMVAGIFFGGYFGLTPEQAPAFMLAADGMSFKGQLINAASGTGPLTFLILALGIGIVHVLFGKVVDGYWKIKQKQYIDALFDSVLWIYFILVILGFGLASTGTVLPVEWAPILKWCTLGGTAAMVLTQGRKQKGIFAKAGIGVLSLYGLVGYLGDILSYSRIMALGLGTGIIAFAMNTIAGLAYEMIPYVGFIFAGFVLVLGHVMNLVLSALGAFIHSARLQFVEFFSKFMEGGGTEFKPFKRNCKYIIIQ